MKTTAHDSPLVCILAYNNLAMFEYSIALEIFALPRPEFSSWYRHHVVATDAGDIKGLGGVRIDASNNLELLADASLIIVPGWSGKVSTALKTALIKATKNVSAYFVQHLNGHKFFLHHLPT